MDLYNNALKLNPRNSLAYYKRALIKMNVNLLQDAAKDFTTAIQANPKDFMSHTGLGLIKYKYGKYKESIEHYDNALAIDSEHVPALGCSRKIKHRAGHVRTRSHRFDTSSCS